ncbi:MAG: DUF1587 domain-containing protein [Verrucomicrobiales bacterium]
MPTLLSNLSLPAAAVAAITAIASAAPGDEAKFAPDAAGFRAIAQPYFERHCVACHGDKKTKGELHLARDLKNDFLSMAESAKWGEILDAVNAHEMPPEDEPQPTPEEAGKFADWVAGELVRAEVSKKATKVVLRRLNRTEYANTIRDLLGVRFDPDAFPADPPAGGFDNIGSALSLSPLHLELYYEAAQAIIGEAIVPGEQPPAIKWRFEPEESTAGADRTRVERGKNRIILNGGRNEHIDGFTVAPDRLGPADRSRDFALEHPGDYIIRFRAASRVPTREAVVKMMRGALTEREKGGGGEAARTSIPPAWKQQLEHFRTEPMHGYATRRGSGSRSTSALQPTFARELTSTPIFLRRRSSRSGFPSTPSGRASALNTPTICPAC